MRLNQSSQPPQPVSRLFEKGAIGLAYASNRRGEINRGMPLITRDGYLTGHVAAVVIDLTKNEVTAVLFNRGRQVADYRLINIDAIEYISEHVILLNINRESTASLSEWDDRIG